MTSTDPVGVTVRLPGLVAGGVLTFALATGADVEFASDGAGGITVGAGGGVAEGSASRLESLA